jgi:LysR family transcriptional regulator, positive regulator for ilvC
MLERGSPRTRIDGWLRTERSAAKVYSEVSGPEAILVSTKLGSVPALVLEKSPQRGALRVHDERLLLAPFRLAARIERTALKASLIGAFLASIGGARGWHWPGQRRCA